jgi:hypothetical protein
MYIAKSHFSLAFLQDIERLIRPLDETWKAAKIRRTSIMTKERFDYPRIHS